MHQTDSAGPDEEVQDRQPATKEFRPDIEGLRAVAVLAVVLFHADLPGVGGGFVGVDVFFVMSGFLITGLLWREVSVTGSVRLRNFYGARARRLLPASATVGVITLIGSVALLPPLLVRPAIEDGIASALYVSNYWFAQQGVNYFASHFPPSPFQHYWSLGVEEQFYLVWPALIIGTAWLTRLVRRRTNSNAPSKQRPYLVLLALIASLSFAMSLVITYVATPVAFFSLPTRAWQLAAGGLVALTTGHWRRLRPRAAAITGSAGLGVILLACTLLSPATFYPGIAALFPTLGAALVIGAGCAAPLQGCGRILALPAMRAVGRVSYSWYLWHWPVLVLAPALVGHPLGLAARLAAALVSGGLAVFTLRFIENPLRFAAPIRRSALASLALGGAATAAAVCVGVALLDWVPVPAVAAARGPAAAPLTISAEPPHAGDNIAAYYTAVRQGFAQVQAAVATAADVKSVPSNLNPPFADVAAEATAMVFNGCVRTANEGGQPECGTGSTASPTKVALVGDSHAAMWIPAFQQIATQQDWRVEIMAKEGCPPMDVPITTQLFTPLVEHFRHCEQWRAQIMARLRAEQPRLVVVSMWRGYRGGNGNGWLSGFTPYDPAWIDSLTHLVQQLRATGAKVLVLGPIPDPQTSTPACLSDHLDDATVCSPHRSTAVSQPGIAAEARATQAGGGQYADLTELFCATERCPVIVGNTMVYFDSSHLTLEYSRVLAPVIGSLADCALAQG